MLFSSLGATEWLALPYLPKDPQDWAYLKFNEEYAGIEFREIELTGLFELVMLRRQDLDTVQGIFVTFPQLQEYHTKDCFTKHPTKPGLWKYESRLDDIIVLSNGEKINPVTMEGIITTCPGVKGCLIVGQSRFQTALLVEPKSPEVDKDKSLKRLQPFVHRANATCQKYGRVSMDCVFFTKPEKPLARAAKGTVQRARSNALYQTEINECYSKLDRNKDKPAAMDLVLTSPQAAEESLRAYVQAEMGIDIQYSRNEDLFSALGMDSLQTISLVRTINAALKGQKRINVKQIYHNPTIEKLASSFFSSRIREYDDLDADYEEDKATWFSMEKVYQDMISLPPERNSGAKSLRKPAKQIIKSTNPPPVVQPDGGSIAWLQVLGSFLINVNNWGMVNSFGVYQTYYQSILLPEKPASSISWIGTLQGALLLFIGVVSGILFDKGYFGAIHIVASVGLVFAMMMLSLATEYYQIMLTQGLLIGTCSGLLYIPSVALIPINFKTRRGLALGLATSGGAFGGVLYPIVFRRLLDTLGFGWANRIIGFIALLTLAVSIGIVKPIGARTSSRQLLDSTGFVDLPYSTFLLAAFFLFAGILVPFFLVSDFASTSSIHASSDLSFYLLAVLNSAQLFGRIVPAMISDYIRAEIMLFFAEVLLGVLGFCWILVHSLGGYIPWLIVYGFGSGMCTSLPPAVLPFVSPSLAVMGTRLGMLYAAAGVGVLISTPVATAADESSGGYLGAQLWTGACCTGAAAFFAVTAIEAWKRRRLYESKRDKAIV